MKTNQATLTGEKTDETDEITTNPEKKTTKPKSDPSTTEPALTPPEQRGGDGCCPWCLAASKTFEHHEDGRVGCENCDAVIPINENWYERGEKIII
ncbi:MAG TPA: hypothetical protein VFJ06_00265 [Halococcus sp.]|nr:hypothetical protein [Halococcus sp.]